MSMRVLLAGISTRAAAESAANAGFAVTAIDAFADLDQHPAVTAYALPRGFGPLAAVRTASKLACDAVSYLSNFENHPSAVQSLAASRALWGNSPDVLRRVRNPYLLADALAARGIKAPRVGGESDAQWLMKPLASGGGRGIRPWKHGRRLRRDSYLQEFIDGVPASIVFVANGREAVVLGLSRQLAGLRSFGGSRFEYCGNVLDPALAADTDLACAARTIVDAITSDFGLTGVNGIDVIIQDGVPWPIEVNPRWSSSMELVERAFGISVFGTHARACADAALPDFDILRTGPDAAFGKAIVYAREDVTIGDTRPWLGDLSISDVPRQDDRIRAGRPVCTVFAEGRDFATCLAGLEQRAAQVYAELIPSGALFTA
jgi:uncharacterized protein